MGCDGGTIPKRDELVKMKKKPEQKDKEAELSFKWRHCAMSQQVLQEPISACGLGRLYSKSNVIESLLDKANIPETVSHIKSMKDIKDLRLTKNPAYKHKAEKSEGAIDERGSPYICPIIGLEMSGRFRFVFFWSCGCVMSERAYKEVKSNVCNLCLEPFEKSDVVTINPSDDEIESMRENMLTRQVKLKLKKKNKSAPCATVTETSGVSTNNQIKIEDTSAPGCSKPHPQGTPIAVPTLKKTIEIKQKGKRPGISSIQDPQYKKAKEDYSVAKDPKATDVFKSLFTTHKSEQEQKRAHWITYNPFYN